MGVHKEFGLYPKKQRDVSKQILVGEVGREWPDSCFRKFFLMQCEKDLEESRLQAERGCGTIIPFRLIGASEVERSHDGDGVAETSSWLPADSQFHWSGGDRLQSYENQIEYKC